MISDDRGGPRQKQQRGNRSVRGRGPAELPGLRAGAGLLVLSSVVLALMAIQRPHRRPGPGDPPPARLPDMRLDLNRATAAELQVLPGIGPATASSIVESRAGRPFGNLGELDRVRGVGPRRLSSWREHLVVRVGKDREEGAASSE